MMAAIMVMSGASAQLVPLIGARPLLIAGSATATGGMFWLSRISEHSHYATGLLGPTLVAGAGLGMLFLPLSVVALSRVREADAGVASSLLNAGQQVGGSIGLAVLGTVAWTTFANSIRSQAAAAARTGYPVHASGSLPAAIYQHALAAGFSRGFEVAAGIMLLALIVTIAAIRVRRADLDGAQQTVTAGPGPGRRCRPARRTEAMAPGQITLRVWRLTPVMSEPFHTSATRSRLSSSAAGSRASTPRVPCPGWSTAGGGHVQLPRAR